MGLKISLKSSSMLSFFFSDMMDKKSVNFSFLLKLIFVRFSGIASSEKDNVTIIILINNRRFRYAKAANTLRTVVRGNFNIHGTKNFQDAVFHQKSKI